MLCICTHVACSACSTSTYVYVVKIFPHWWILVLGWLLPLVQTVHTAKAVERRKETFFCVIHLSFRYGSRIAVLRWCWYLEWVYLFIAYASVVLFVLLVLLLNSLKAYCIYAHVKIREKNVIFSYVVLYHLVVVIVVVGVCLLETCIWYSK